LPFFRTFRLSIDIDTPIVTRIKGIITEERLLEPVTGSSGCSTTSVTIGGSVVVAGGSVVVAGGSVVVAGGSVVVAGGSVVVAGGTVVTTGAFGLFGVTAPKDSPFLSVPPG
jgi:hypothetical protein